MPKRRDGQSSTEFLLIVLLGMLMISPVFLMLSEQQTKMDTTRRNVETKDILDRLVSTSRIVHAQGPPSKMTIETVFPEGIRETRIDDNEMIFRIRRAGLNSSMVRATDFKLNGSLSPEAGRHSISVQAKESGNSTLVDIND